MSTKQQNHLDYTMRSSSSCFALALLLVVTLAGVRASSRGGLDVGVSTSDGVPEDHELLTMERFHGWMAKHGRSYATAEEKLRRFEIYRSNVEFIESANRDGRLSYKLRENHFTDLTHEEFLATHTMRAPPPETMTNDDEMLITTRAGDVEVGACQPASSKVPHRINWADRGKVTRVKDQNTKCGACWAFSAVAAIESAYAIAEELESPPELSEQELIDCDKRDHGCRSGKMSEAFKWVQWNGGIANDSSYPYEGRDDRACDVEKLGEHTASIKGFRFVSPAKCEEKLMEAVAVRPVSVGFDPNDPCFQHYWYGKYNGTCYVGGEYIGPCTNNRLTHALTIVGYVGKGDDEDKYWIAKNSWGVDWGDEGYVWLQKDVVDPKGLCGLATNPVYPIA